MGYGSSPRPPGPCSPAEPRHGRPHHVAEAGLGPPYSLVGLSMGSNLALAFGCTWPDEVDTIVGLAFPYFATPRRCPGRAAGQRLDPPDPGPAPSGRGGGSPLWSIAPAQWGHAFPPRHLHACDGERRLARRLRGLRVEHALLHADVSPTTRCSRPLRRLPRLFVHGSEDRWARRQRSSRSLAPFARHPFTVIDGAPHNIVVTEPERRPPPSRLPRRSAPDGADPPTLRR